MQSDCAAAEESRAVGAQEDSCRIEDDPPAEAGVTERLNEEDGALDGGDDADEHGDHRVRAAAIGGATHGGKLADTQAVQLGGAVLERLRIWNLVLAHQPKR